MAHSVVGRAFVAQDYRGAMREDGANVYRVTVRGQFRSLSKRSRSSLVSSVDEHDIFLSSFTEEGTFTYDRRLVAFNLRYEVRIRSSDHETSPCGFALVQAEEFLRIMAIGHGPLRAAAMDMSTMTKRAEWSVENPEAHTAPHPGNSWKRSPAKTERTETQASRTRCCNERPQGPHQTGR